MKMWEAEGWRRAFHREKGRVEALSCVLGVVAAINVVMQEALGGCVSPPLQMQLLPKLIRSVCEL